MARVFLKSSTTPSVFLLLLVIFLMPLLQLSSALVTKCVQCGKGGIDSDGASIDVPCDPNLIKVENCSHDYEVGKTYIGCGNIMFTLNGSMFARGCVASLDGEVKLNDCVNVNIDDDDEPGSRKTVCLCDTDGCNLRQGLKPIFLSIESPPLVDKMEKTQFHALKHYLSQHHKVHKLVHSKNGGHNEGKIGIDSNVQRTGKLRLGKSWEFGVRPLQKLEKMFNDSSPNVWKNNSTRDQDVDNDSDDTDNTLVDNNTTEQDVDDNTTDQDVDDTATGQDVNSSTTEHPLVKQVGTQSKTNGNINLNSISKGRQEIRLESSSSTISTSSPKSTSSLKKSTTFRSSPKSSTTTRSYLKPSTASTLSPKSSTTFRSPPKASAASKSSPKSSTASTLSSPKSSTASTSSSKSSTASTSSLKKSTTFRSSPTSWTASRLGTIHPTVQFDVNSASPSTFDKNLTIKETDATTSHSTEIRRTGIESGFRIKSLTPLSSDNIVVNISSYASHAVEMKISNDQNVDNNVTETSTPKNDDNWIDWENDSIRIAEEQLDLNAADDNRNNKNVFRKGKAGYHEMGRAFVTVKHNRISTSNVTEETGNPNLGTIDISRINVNSRDKDIQNARAIQNKNNPNETGSKNSTSTRKKNNVPQSVHQLYNNIMIVLISIVVSLLFK